MNHLSLVPATRAMRRPAFDIWLGDTCRLTTHQDAIEIARQRAASRGCRQSVRSFPVLNVHLPPGCPWSYWLIQDVR